MKKGLLFIGITVLVVVLGAASLQVYANHRVRKLVDEYAASLEPDLNFQAESVRYNLLKRNAHIQGIVLDGNTVKWDGIDAITVDEVIVYSYDTQNAPPHYAHIEAEGLVIPIPFTEEALVEAEQTGFAREELTELKIDVQSKYRFDPETKEFLVHQNDLQFRGLCGVRSKVHMGNIDPVFFQPTDPRRTNPFTLIAALVNIQLVSSEVFLEVGALADRIFEGLAQRSSMPPKDFKEQFMVFVSFMFERYPDFNTELKEKTIEFIREPGDVTITMSPARPVSVMDVMDMSNNSDLLMEALGVQIEIR